MNMKVFTSIFCIAIFMMYACSAMADDTGKACVWVEAEELLPQQGYRDWLHPDFSKGISRHGAHMVVKNNFIWLFDWKGQTGIYDLYVKAYSHYEGSQLRVDFEGKKGNWVSIQKHASAHFQWHLLRKNLEMTPGKHEVTFETRNAQILDSIVLQPAGSKLPVGNELLSKADKNIAKNLPVSLTPSVELLGRDTYHVFPSGVTRMAYNPYHFLGYTNIPKGENIEFVAELPTNLEFIEIHANTDVVKPQGSADNISVSGKEYQRYITKLPENFYLAANTVEPDVGRAFAFYIKPTDTLEKNGKAKFYFIVNGQKCKEKEVTLVPFEPTKIVKRPEKWIISFADQGAQFHKGYERDYLQKCASAGLNMLVSQAPFQEYPIDPRYAETTLKFRDIAGELGVNIYCHSTPFQNTWKKIHEHLSKGLSTAVDVDGKKCPGLCPSLAGGLDDIYQEFIDRHFKNAVANGIVDFTVDQEIYDNEQSDKICFCETCLKDYEDYRKSYYPKLSTLSPREFENNPAKYPEHHKAWMEFRMNQMTTLWYGRMMKSAKKHLAEKYGKPIEPHFIFYSNTPSNWPDRDVQTVQWKTLNNFTDLSRLGSVGPMAYGDTPQRTRACTLESMKGIPSGGRLVLGLHGRANLKPSIVEAIVHGANGFYTWYTSDPDAKTFSDIAEALNLLVPYEDIFNNGTRIEIGSPADTHACLVEGKTGQTVLYVAWDGNNKNVGMTIPVTLPLEGKYRLSDVANKTNQVVELSKTKSLEVAIPADGYAVYHLEKLPG